MAFRLEYIKRFLENHSWQMESMGNNFINYTPPIELDLPSDYTLQVPINESKKGVQEFCKRLVNIISDIYYNEYTEDDFNIIFSSPHSIFFFRIIDKDTQQGNIKLVRHNFTVDGIYKILQNTVTFISTHAQIFGNAKVEVDKYLESCRYLQTQKGSFITKIELPAINVNIFENKPIGNKLFDVLEFIAKEVITKDINEIDSDYVSYHRDMINVELFLSIYNIFRNVKISNATFTLFNQENTRKFDAGRINKNLSHFYKYIKKVKGVLLNDVPLEVNGYVYNLNSNTPKEAGLITMRAEIANEKHIIKVFLEGDNYDLAIEAHRSNREVMVKGIAKQKKEIYHIEKADEFYFAI